MLDCRGESCSRVTVGGKQLPFWHLYPRRLIKLARHLMTGVGAYFYITWGVWLRHCLDQRQDEYELVWPRLLTSMPVIVQRKNVAAYGVQNGFAKKSL